MLVLVALGGGVGAAARFVVDGLIRERRGGGLPVATMAVNVVGSLVFGVLVGLMVYRDVEPGSLVLVGTGFCGGFTTFSPAMVETVRLAQAGELRRATVNLVGTLVLALAAAALGTAVVALTAG